MFQLPYSLDLQIAPTAEAIFRAARPFTPRIEHAVTQRVLWHRYVPDTGNWHDRTFTCWIAALPAAPSGAHLCLQGAGTLDCINSMSYEQFVIDVEMWGYITRLSRPPEVSPDGLAVDLVCSTPGDYLGSEHTVAHMREELFQPELAVTLPYEQWIATRGPAEDGPDVAILASQHLQRPADSALPSIEPGLLAELERYAATRRAALG